MEEKTRRTSLYQIYVHHIEVVDIFAPFEDLNIKLDESVLKEVFNFLVTFTREDQVIKLSSALQLHFLLRKLPLKINPL